MKKSKNIFIVLGDQLFPEEFWPSDREFVIFMCEDYGLCTHYKYHKHKIAFFLQSMRNHASQLSNLYDVEYFKIQKEVHFFSQLDACINLHKTKKISMFRIEDVFFEEKIIQFCEEQNIQIEFLDSPKFLCTDNDFKSYLDSVKRPFMKTFYEKQRRKFNILIDENDKPIGGQWSFDQENRNKLKKNVEIPERKKLASIESLDIDLVKDIEDLFSDHWGDLDQFWLGTHRKDALEALDLFFLKYFKSFGTYQDAITSRDDFVFHSLLSMYINAGLLLPQEVIDGATQYANENNVPLSSLEGFIRQILGWREFVYGIYKNYDAEQKKSNHWGHHRKLGTLFLNGETGIPVLDDAIHKAHRTGYQHHIERLMVMSNFMVLCEIEPMDVYTWFMEMFVDSADWVMGPNVFGMGLFSDGGIFATKPYICGSNYYLKMGDYSKGDWCTVVDGLYWRFISKHEESFKKNPRMSLMVRQLEKVRSNKPEIFKLAEDFIHKVTLD